MTDTVLDLSERPAKLAVRMGLLVILQRDGGETTLPLEELAVLIVSHRQVIFTQAVLAGLAQAGGVFVACDERHMPVAMMLPIEGHHLQSERFAQQAEASRPTCKRLWQQIIRAKVRAQGRLLENLHGDDRGLLAWAEKVKSGDTQNIEGQASRRYWPALFNDPGFRRNRDAEDQNAQLNYGYGVLRAIVARAICGAGLHPSLGLHHHNRYDAYRLADDLMEPYRPVVDRAVARHVWEKGAAGPLDKEAKGALLRALGARYTLKGEERSLFDIAARMSASLAQVFAGERRDLALPEV